MHILTALLALCLGIPPHEASALPPQAQLQGRAPSDVDDQLSALREAYTLPALAISLQSDTSELRTAHSGVLNLNHPNDTVQPDTLWPLGSNTKSMTATTIALLIQDGLLDWDTPLSEIFSPLYNNTTSLPDYLAIALSQPLHASHANTTVLNLLTHRSGLVGTFGIDATPLGVSQIQPMFDYPREVSRALAASSSLALPAPGERGVFKYANDNYIVLGFIIDVLTNSTAEKVIAERLWEPLEMRSARFGPPDLDGGEGVWPHLVDFLTGDTYAYRDEWMVGARDLPGYVNTAGGAWMGVSDYGTWLRLMVDEALWDKVGLDRETVERLQTRFDGPVNRTLGELEYTAGAWVWAGEGDCLNGEGEGVCLTHTGSNTMNVGAAWVETARKTTVAALTNAPLAGGGEKGTDVAIAMMLNGTIIL